MRCIRYVLLVCAVMAFTGNAGAQPATCQLVKRYSTQPLTINAHGMPTVPLKVDGQALNVLVDIVGTNTMITQAAADRLKLESVPIPGGHISREDTGVVDRQAVTHTIEIAGITVAGKTLAVIPSGRFDSFVGADGILAQDYLGMFDIDFDFEHGSFGLYSQDHCPGKVVYWTNGPHAEIPFRVIQEGSARAIAVPAQIDGKEALAILSPEAEKTQMAGPVADKYFGGSQARFKSLSIGGATIANPGIRIFPGGGCNYLGTPCFALGMDILRHFHLYVSYKENLIYATGDATTAMAVSTPTAGARLPPLGLPLYAAFRAFCADTGARPEAVKAAVEAAGGKRRVPLGVASGAWDITVNGQAVVLTVTTVPSGDACQIDSQADAGASIEKISAWTGVGRFDTYVNGLRSVHHCQYQVKSDKNLGYGSREEADTALAEGRLWDLTLVRDHDSGSVSLIHLLK